MTQINALYPRLVVADAARAIDFYVAALGATETQRHAGPDGKIVHAEVTIGAARVARQGRGRRRSGADHARRDSGHHRVGHLWMISQPLDALP
jgi:uncharacterized glyoxalase superfamily protein PhnB